MSEWKHFCVFPCFFWVLSCMLQYQPSPQNETIFFIFNDGRKWIEMLLLYGFFAFYMLLMYHNKMSGGVRERGREREKIVFIKTDINLSYDMVWFFFCFCEHKVKKRSFVWKLVLKHLSGKKKTKKMCAARSSFDSCRIVIFYFCGSSERNDMGECFFYFLLCKTKNKRVYISCVMLWECGAHFDK